MQPSPKGVRRDHPQKPEYEWVKEKKTQHVDLRWKTFLPPYTNRRCVSNQVVNQYLSQLGIAITDDGTIIGSLEYLGKSVFSRGFIYKNGSMRKLPSSCNSNVSPG